MTRRARAAVRGGAQLIIFPEGTRTPPGAPPAYKTGIAQIYVTCGVPCLPIALNSGLFWPRRTFMRYPGTLVVEFLDPLPPGLSRDEFLRRIRTGIEEATDRLVQAGLAEQAQLFGRGGRPPALFQRLATNFSAFVAGRLKRVRVVQHQRQLMQRARRENLPLRSPSPSTAHSRDCCRNGRVPAAHGEAVRAGESRPAYCTWPRSTT